MLRPDEQLLLGHTGLLPQARQTLQTALGNRQVILTNGIQAGDGLAGTTQGGNSSFVDGLVYANTTIPAGNTVANTAAATNFASIYAVPANAPQVGQVIFIKAWGVYGTDVIAPTLTLDVRYRLVTVLTTTAVTCLAALANKGWWLDAQLHVTAIGAGGTMECQGYVNLSTALTTVQSVDMTNTAAVATNTTLASNLAIRATWGTANANNTITLRNMSIRIEQAQNVS